MKKISRCRVKILLLVFASVLAGSTSSHGLAAPSPLERNIEEGEKAFTDGNFLKAERYLKKAMTLLDKSSPADERSARVSERLGETYFKQGKFDLADSLYKKSLDLLKGLSLDQSSAAAHLRDLNEVYRPINLTGFDETATSFVNHVGASSASAMKQEDTHHIDISLQRKFQQKLQELINDFVPKKADGATAPLELPKTEGAPEVKQLRLDKKITFDLKRVDGNLQLANIQGIFFDVGLWVKLKDLVMLNSNPGKPEVELTAGAFGVDKKVKTGLPQTVFQRLCEGLEKFDPFSATQKQAEPTPSPSPSGQAPQEHGSPGTTAPPVQAPVSETKINAEPSPVHASGDTAPGSPASSTSVPESGLAPVTKPAAGSEWQD